MIFFNIYYIIIFAYFFVDYFCHQWYNCKKLCLKGCETMVGLERFFFELMSLIMSFLFSIGAITTPGTADVIRQLNDDANIKFVVTGDPQVCNYNPSREANLVASAQDLMNSQDVLDAFIMAGDIAENGFEAEFNRVYEDLKDVPANNFIVAAGNHDIRLRDFEEAKENVLTFMNAFNDEENHKTQLYYEYDVKGYKFLVIASDEATFEEPFISSEQLQWLNLSLKEYTKNGDPVFVVTHYPLAESHGLPNTWGSANSTPTEPLQEYVRRDSYDFTGSIGEQNNEVYDIISQYENVFFISGHLHTGFGYYTYQTIDAENNVQSINVPSVSIDNKDGQYNNPGTGLYIEVTDDQVICYARDFAEGRFLTTDDFKEAVKVYDIQ